MHVYPRENFLRDAFLRVCLLNFQIVEAQKDLQKVIALELLEGGGPWGLQSSLLPRSGLSPSPEQASHGFV